MFFSQLPVYEVAPHFGAGVGLGRLSYGEQGAVIHHCLGPPTKRAQYVRPTVALPPLCPTPATDSIGPPFMVQHDEAHDDDDDHHLSDV